MLSPEEESNGCNVHMDSGLDTYVASKHAYIVEVIEGFLASIQGFNDGIPALDKLPIINALYAYDYN